MDVYITRFKQDDHEGPFVAISLRLLDEIIESLSPIEFRILVYVARRQKGARQISPVTVRSLAETLGCSTKTAQRALQKFQALGLLEARKGGYLLKSTRSEDLRKNIAVVSGTPPRRRPGEHGSVFPGATPMGKKVLQIEEHTSNLRLSVSKEEGEEEGGSHPPALRLVGKTKEESAEDELYPEGYLEGLLETQTKLAKELGNPTPRKSFFLKGQVPASLSLPNVPEGKEQLSAQVVFLTMTNVMLQIQRSGKFRMKQVSLPGNLRDAEMFGDVICNMLVEVGSWREAFTSFYKWVLTNRDDWSYNRLAYYYSDWFADTLHARGYLGGRD